jgi:hypothetical protein
MLRMRCGLTCQRIVLQKTNKILCRCRSIGISWAGALLVIKLSNVVSRRSENAEHLVMTSTLGVPKAVDHKSLKPSSLWSPIRRQCARMSVARGVITNFVNNPQSYMAMSCQVLALRSDAGIVQEYACSIMRSHNVSAHRECLCASQREVPITALAKRFSM